MIRKKKQTNRNLQAISLSWFPASNQQKAATESLRNTPPFPQLPSRVPGGRYVRGGGPTQANQLSVEAELKMLDNLIDNSQLATASRTQEKINFIDLLEVVINAPKNCEDKTSDILSSRTK